MLLLTRIEAGEHTFRPGTMPRDSEDFEGLIQQLRSLRDRRLIRLAEGRTCGTRLDAISAPVLVI